MQTYRGSASIALFVVGFWIHESKAQTQPLTLSLVPVGGKHVNEGQVVTIEAFLTANQNIGIRGGQVDLPCILPAKPGSTGSISLIPGFSAGATTDPDGDGVRGPSSGGVPYIFGPGGIGPANTFTCIIANTPAPGALPVSLLSGQTRYLGTFFYAVSDGASGEFHLNVECTNRPDRTCPDVPSASDTTRYLDTSPGMGTSIPLEFVGTTLVVGLGRCCRMSACLGELSETSCVSNGGTDWAEGADCSAECPPCNDSTECDDLSICTMDECSEGSCIHLPASDGSACDDGLFCTASDTCATGICRGMTIPCPEGHCSEALDQCVECLLFSHCDDGDVCTNDNCNLGTGVCDHDFNTSSCDDELYCTVSDRCSLGVCAGSPRPCPGGCDEKLDICHQCTADDQCGDNNTCTADTCDDGICRHEGLPNGTACDDGRFCTLTDICNSSFCFGSGHSCTAPEAPICDESRDRCVQCLASSQCNDQNPCTIDSCDVESGLCVFSSNTNLCNDGLFCTVDDRCGDGVCGGSPRSCPGGAPCDEENDRCLCFEDIHCDDQNVCTVDACVTAVCAHEPVTESIPCDDGRFCTIEDVCVNGVCLGDVASCPPGLACDDDVNACVEPDLVLSAVPIGGSEVLPGQTVSVEMFVTANFNTGTRGGQIDLPCSLPGGPGSAGEISVLPSGAGATTDPDGDGLRGPSMDGTPYIFGAGGLGPYAPATCIIATQSLGPAAQLQAGVKRYLGTFFYEVSDCAAGEFNVRFECTDQPGGFCSGVPVPINTTRYRDNTAGQGQLFLLGFQGATLSVTTGQCCRGNTCLGEFNEACCRNEQGGLSWNPGLTCNDACLCASAADCNDENPCTKDTCTDGLCLYEAVQATCDDGLFCTVDDQCASGSCMGSPRQCPDGFPCDEMQDQCLRCQSDPQCSDKNSCTVDTCVNESCRHEARPNGEACDDGLFCTATDTCLNAVCKGSGATCADPEVPFCDEKRNHCARCLTHVHCNDQNPCTTDTCQVATGLCAYKAHELPCDDGSFCTVDDLCTNGTCVGSGTPCGADMACDPALLTCVPADLTLSIDPIGDGRGDSSNTSAFEVLVTANRALGVRGGQVDLPCILTPLPGSMGTVMVTRATTDPDGDGLKGPSSQGLPYLFGGAGLGPTTLQSCITANTPPPGGTGSSTLPMNAMRYLGTYYYEISECASGDFEVSFECGVSGRECPGAPSASSTTRFRDGSAGMGQLLLLSLGSTTISVGVGQCCRGNTCLGEFREECCRNTHGGLFWNADATCEDACLCGSAADCNDANPCTEDSCADGLCLYAPIEASCDDGLFCTAVDRCEIGTCVGKGDPCERGLCSEVLDACIECIRNQDCNDGNVCTKDRCDFATGRCFHTDNSKPCDDGLFCTKPDRCQEGFCVGTPRRCPIGETCNEELDRCAPP